MSSSGPFLRRVGPPDRRWQNLGRSDRRYADPTKSAVPILSSLNMLIRSTSAMPIWIRLAMQPTKVRYALRRQLWPYQGGQPG